MVFTLKKLFQLITFCTIIILKTWIQDDLGKRNAYVEPNHAKMDQKIGGGSYFSKVAPISEISPLYFKSSSSFLILAPKAVKVAPERVTTPKDPTSCRAAGK